MTTNKLMIKVSFLVPAVLWMAIISYLSSRTDVPNMQELFKHADKLAHFVVYFVLGIFLTFATYTILLVREVSKKLVIFFIGFAFAIIDEFHQSLVPNRVSDIFDIIADILGIITSLIIYNLLVKFISNFFNKINLKL